MDIETEKYEVDILHDRLTGKVVGEIWQYPDDRKPITTDGWTRLPPQGWSREHRIGGPAVMRWDPTTGIAVKECWCIRGKLHREDGPALIKRDPNTGSVIFSSWYLNGTLVPRAQRPKLKARKLPESAPATP
jgi:hypothetical protein